MNKQTELSREEQDLYTKMNKMIFEFLTECPPCHLAGLGTIIDTMLEISKHMHKRKMKEEDTEEALKDIPEEEVAEFSEAMKMSELCSVLRNSPNVRLALGEASIEELEKEYGNVFTKEG